jgi:molybdate transport system ATP-binding protein
MSADLLQVRLRLPRADFRLDVDLALPASGITVLFGPSGSGKTSVLRCVAGLEHAPEGQVRVAGECWQDTDRGVFLPTHQRPLGYVFQEASLFDHLDVTGNLRYGLRRVRCEQAEATLQAAIELLGIGHLLKRRTDALSGGERQRVAIARALATSPRVLLLDEPMAALDQARRQDILPWLERLRDELKLPMLYVTHSVNELARLADHLVVLDQGRVRSQGPLATVLASLDALVLLGDEAGVVISGQVLARDAAWHLQSVGFDEHVLWLASTDAPLQQTVRLRILARDVSLCTQPPRSTSIQNQLPGVVDALGPGNHPGETLVRVRCASKLLLARITSRAVQELGLVPGMPVWAQVKSVAIVH